MSVASLDFERVMRAADENISAKAMLSAVMVEWGGPAGLAHEMRKDFEAIPVGNANRVKINALIVQALLKYGDTSESGDDREAVQEQLDGVLKRIDEALSDKSE